MFCNPLIENPLNGNNQEIISDLKGLVNIVDEGTEDYARESETTDSAELKDGDHYL